MLSQASASLIFRTHRGDIPASKKALHVIWLGILLAITWLSGQGYIQVGVILGVLPVLLLLILDEKWRINPPWKDYGKALLISLLLTGVFLVPLVHFFPNFAKDGDPFLTNLQRWPRYRSTLSSVIKHIFGTEILGHDLNALYKLYFYWLDSCRSLPCSLCFSCLKRNRA